MIELAFDLLFTERKVSAVRPPTAGRVLLFLLTVGPSGGSGLVLQGNFLMCQIAGVIILTLVGPVM